MQLRDEVKRVLWEEWDPVGVRRFDGLNDEYDSYAGTIAQYLEEGRDESAIVQHLGRLQTDAMGLSSIDSARDRRVARLLLSLRSRKRISGD